MMFLKSKAPPLQKVCDDSTLKEVIQKAADDLYLSIAKYFSDENT